MQVARPAAHLLEADVEGAQDGARLLAGEEVVGGDDGEQRRAHRVGHVRVLKLLEHRVDLLVPSQNHLPVTTRRRSLNKHATLTLIRVSSMVSRVSCEGRKPDFSWPRFQPVG